MKAMNSSQTPGRAFDAVIVARRRLSVAHWVLGILGSISLWPQLPYEHLNNAFASGAGIVIIFRCALGWAPYLISWFYSKSVLDGNARGALAFSIGAALITLVGFGLYQNLLSFREAPSPYLVSIAVTLSLIGLAKACSHSWAPIWK
jgi:hypothetical protein